MSTQHSSSMRSLSIPFTLSHSPQTFRLFELPEELVELITAGTAPGLQLKSSSSSSSSSAKASDYVHLTCEALEKSWAVRQVSTSNEVYIIQPGAKQLQEGIDMDVDKEMASPGTLHQDTGSGLRAIAKTDSVLELLPATIDAEATLRRILPTYSLSQLVEQVERAKRVGLGHLVTNRDDSFLDVLSEGSLDAAKEDYFRAVPAPDGVIERSWKDLCICKMLRMDAEHGQAKPGLEYVIPEPTILLHAWKNIRDSFLLREDLPEVFTLRDFGLGQDEECDEYRPVKHAIWTLLCADGGSTNLNPERTVIWSGRLCLEVMKNEVSGLQSENLLQAWLDLLPSKWAKDFKFEGLDTALVSTMSINGQEVMRWERPGGLPAEDIMKVETLRQKTTDKRNWHEKFKQQRNVKK